MNKDNVYKDIEEILKKNLKVQELGIVNDAFKKLENLENIEERYNNLKIAYDECKEKKLEYSNKNNELTKLVEMHEKKIKELEEKNEILYRRNENNNLTNEKSQYHAIATTYEKVFNKIFGNIAFKENLVTNLSHEVVNEPEYDKHGYRSVDQYGNPLSRYKDKVTSVETTHEKYVKDEVDKEED